MDLVDLVGDVDHGDAAALQGPDHREQALRLRFAQGGVGLVHDDEARLDGKRLGDLDELALGDAQRAHDAARVDSRPTSASAARVLLLQLPARRTCPRRDGMRPMKTFSITFRVGSTESSWWMTAMPGGNRLVGRGELDRAPLEGDPARVAHDDAAEDLHEGRFSCAVLSDHRVHLAAAHLEADIVQRLEPAVALVQALKLSAGILEAPGSIPSTAADSRGRATCARPAFRAIAPYFL